MPGSLLSEGDEIVLASSGVACRVVRLLGSGGQGEVHEVAIGPAEMGASYALKCYHPTAATKQQWEALSRLVDLGAPSERFLWPQDLAELPRKKTFGYLMALREARFRGLVDLVRRQVGTSFRSLTTAGYQLADSFLALHSQGLCYRDISLGNVFFDPANGDILICDNDNVAVDGEGYQSVLGTTGFMAPEVERLEATPSTRTDLYSLSVLLFLIFVNHHPLIGERELSFECLDQAAFRYLYGTNPLFVHDPNDRSNQPVPGVHDNAIILWPLYPAFFRQLFVRAFTDGLWDPSEGRVRESTWKSAVVRLRDLITTCGCGAELFFNPDEGVIAGAPPGRCWSCGGTPPVPARLIVGRTTVVLNPDTTLYPHHLGGALYDFGAPVASVSRHPMDPRVQGLQNLSQENWMATEPDGVIHYVSPGRSVRLTDGITITFPGAEATIVAEATRTD